MNTFHFHLSDDEGWRIEIPGLPELTGVGSQRCLLPQLGSGPFSDNNGGGYFSRADYIEIVEYTQARHITVIPEIDMPAHARAAVKDARAFVTPRVAVNFWDTLYWGGFDSASDWAQKGYDMVICSPDYLYLDFPSEVNPQERGYYWGTRFSDERKIFAFAPDNLPQNAETSTDRDGNAFSAKSAKPWTGAYGLSAQLWSETVRTDPQMEYMIYPRLFAVAERSWHRASWELDYRAGREFIGGQTRQVDRHALLQGWQRFASLLGQRELAKLDKAGIAYRLPVPGAKVVAGVLAMNVALPGVTMEYSLDNGTHWLRYDAAQPPQVSGALQVRSVSADGLRSSRVESL